MYALSRRKAPANSFGHFETFLYMYVYTKALTKYRMHILESAAGRGNKLLKIM